MILKGKKSFITYENVNYVIKKKKGEEKEPDDEGEQREMKCKQRDKARNRLKNPLYCFLQIPI